MNVSHRISYTQSTHTLLRAFAQIPSWVPNLCVCEIARCPTSVTRNGNNVHVRPRVDLIIWIFMILQCVTCMRVGLCVPKWLVNQAESQFRQGVVYVLLSSTLGEQLLGQSHLLISWRIIHTVRRCFQQSTRTHVTRT